MSQVIPPNQYFPTIIYNSQFWTSSSSSGQYLGRIGTPTSIATTTTFTGAIVANDLTVANLINGTALRSINVYSSNNNANATHYLTYTDLSTDGYEQLQKHATLTFNPNQEILTAQNINATSQLRIGGTDITTLFLGVGFSSACAILASSNTFTASNYFQALVYIDDPPVINNYLTASFADNNLITKKYADTHYATGSGYATLTGNNTFQGTNTFGLSGSLNTLTINDIQTNFNQYVTFAQPPSTPNAPSVSTQLTNKNYVDTQIATNCALVASANTYTNTNTFTSGLKSSATPVLSTDVINKSYADTNLSNTSLLSGSNSWSFNNNMTANCPTSGSILLQYNGTTMIEISPTALYSPISIAPDFGNQITFSSAVIFRTSFGLSNGITMTVGDIYGTATLAVDTANGTFQTNTIEPTATGTNITAFSTSTAILNIGNASATMVSTFANNTFPKITLAGKNLFSCDVLRTTAFTISSPFFYLYPVAPTANLVITLPTASATYLGVQFTIRRTGGTTTTTVTSASANIYPINSFTSNTTILASNAFTNTIICSYLGASTYGWFII